MPWAILVPGPDRPLRPWRRCWSIRMQSSPNGNPSLGANSARPAVSVPLLVNVLKDADPSIRNEAMEILVEIGKPAVPTLSRLLSGEKAVYWCCIVLGEIGPDAAEAAARVGGSSQGQPTAGGSPRGGLGGWARSARRRSIACRR